MNEQEERDRIKEEIVKLNEQIKQQQQTLYQLYQRVQQMDGVVAKAAPAENRESRTMENFIGLKVVQLIGIVVLVIGLSIAVKYAIDRELISEVARIGLAYLTGSVLYFFSLQLKKKYAGFSAVLFSGAMASLYFTTYAAFAYYGMMSFAAAFTVMIGLTVFAVYNALHYNRQEIALLGLVGAYAIPFLISQNSDRADLFFLYIGLINIGIVFLAYKRSWPLVTYLAQLVTWILFVGWSVSKETAAHQWTGAIAMTFFFLLFLFNALFKKLKYHEVLERPQVYEVLFNNAMLYLGALLLFSPSFSAGEIGQISFLFFLFTGSQAALFQFPFPAQAAVKKALTICSLFLLIVFIANQWDGVTVTLLWLLLSVLLFTWGAMVKAVWLRLSAILLIGVTLVKLVTLDSLRFTTVQKIISYVILGILLLVISFFYQKFKEQLFKEPS